MKTISILLVCFQACYIQMTFSQFLGTDVNCSPAIASGYEIGSTTDRSTPALGAEAAYGPGVAPGFGYGYGLPANPAPFAGPATYAPGPAYGGAGIGDVEIAGEMPVAGTTLIAGQVPILGAVQFSGEVPAAGLVSISGRCGCGCNGPYMY